MQQSQDGNITITTEKLQSFLNDPAKSDLNVSQLESLVEKYPAFTSARLAYSKKLQLTHQSNFINNIQKDIILLSDKKLLFNFLADSHLGWNEVFELAESKEFFCSEKTITTNDALSLIESFLNRDLVNRNKEVEENNETHHKPEAELDNELNLEKEVQSSYAALNYVNQLMTDLSDECEKNKNPLEHQDLIDKFISFSGEDDNLRTSLSQAKQDSEILNEYNEQEIDNSESTLTPEPSEDDLLTESLAKIYIKQKRYEKALEIIKSLSLKYPKKSVYFADQIRYLELLIANIKK